MQSGVETRGKPSPHPKESHVIETKIDPKQVTFNLSSNSVLIWRRLLLLRYYIGLGSHDLCHVKWVDYDKKNRIIVLNDEEEKQCPKSLNPNLFKSMTQIFVNDQKLLTFTVYYTTLTCLVQGNITQSWVKKEFEVIKTQVESMLIHNTANDNIDIEINAVPLPIQDIEKSASVTLVKSSNSDKANDMVSSSESSAPQSIITDNLQDYVPQSTSVQDTIEMENQGITRPKVTQDGVETTNDLSKVVGNIEQCLHKMELECVDHFVCIEGDLKAILPVQPLIQDMIEKLIHCKSTSLQKSEKWKKR